jgi:flagellar motor switch protein FliG
MIPKHKLIRRLENIAVLEDEGVALITRSLSKLTEKSELPEEKKTRILEIADIIKRESEGHKKAILQMIEKIKMRDKDEF